MSDRCSDPLGSAPYCHHADRCLGPGPVLPSKKEREREQKKKEKEKEDNK